MYYNQDVVERVLDANNIVDVVSEHVNLTKKGSTYFGLCPFHNEKTPSFSVTDKNGRQMYYCYGCHSGGSALTFLMKYDNISYTEAVQTLAARAGISLPKPEYNKIEAEKQKLKNQVYEINKEAAIYFYKLLKSERGKTGLSYLTNRGLSPETIKSYGLGYSDKYRDDLYKYIKSKGYTDEVLKQTGLFVIKENDIHDWFWNRVMYPIMDARGRVIAFGGRVMGDAEPKYLNSPETVIFEKSKNLYGLNVAKKHKDGDFILCEGYMDVIALHQAGFTNAVATLGTALTESHTWLLKRYTPRVFLSYDSDGAGRKAALRAIPMLKNAGLSVKVINLSPFKDPDELIKNMGAEEYRNRIKNARNSLFFEIDCMKEGYDLSDPDSYTKYFNNICDKISYLSDEVERENYVRACAAEFGLDLELLKDKVKKLALNRDHTVRYAPALERADRNKNKEKPSALLKAQKIILSSLASDPGLYKNIEGHLSPEDFSEPVLRPLAAELFNQLKTNNVNLMSAISIFEEADEQEKATDALNYKYDNDDAEADFKKLINDCVRNIKKQSLENKLNSETDIGLLLEIKKEQEALLRLDIFQD